MNGRLYWFALGVVLIAVGCEDLSSPAEVFDAVITDDTARAEGMIKKHPNVVKATWGPRGATLLHCAATNGNVELIDLLLARGADPNAKTFARETPLHWAVSGGKLGAIKHLLAGGADINAKTDSYYETESIRGLHGRDLKRLVDGGTPLHYAAVLSLRKTVGLLIAEGADVHAKDDKGRTPLDLAGEQKGSTVTSLLSRYVGAGLSATGTPEEEEQSLVDLLE